jgi:hypothetical protein
VLSKRPAGTQLASACQSSIAQGDAVTLQPDEACRDQGVKGRALAPFDRTASAGQSDAAQQFSLFFVPCSQHPASSCAASFRSNGALEVGGRPAGSPMSGSSLVQHPTSQNRR